MEPPAHIIVTPGTMLCLKSNKDENINVNNLWNNDSDSFSHRHCVCVCVRANWCQICFVYIFVGVCIYYTKTIELKAILGGVDNPDFGNYSSIFSIRTIFIFQKKLFVIFHLKENLQC